MEPFLRYELDWFLGMQNTWLDELPKCKTKSAHSLTVTLLKRSTAGLNDLLLREPSQDIPAKLIAEAEARRLAGCNALASTHWPPMRARPPHNVFQLADYRS